MSSIASRRRRLALLFVGGLVAALGAAVVNPAAAGKPSGGSGSLPAPVRIMVDGIASDVEVPAEFDTEEMRPAVPYVLVEANGKIVITVSFRDANNNPAAFTKDTKLTVSTNVGALTVNAGLAPKGKSSATIETSLTGPVNRVVLTVGAGTGPKAPTPGVSYIADGPDKRDLRFDVLSDLSPFLTATDGSAFQAGFGGEDGCVQATEAAPVCEVVLLPRGAGSKVLLTVGACDADTSSTYAPCLKGPKGVVGGAVVQALFAQPTTAYKVDSPAVVVVKCDRTLCGTGSIRNRTVLWSLKGNDPLTRADPCPAKNRMAQDGVPCVDYVQSHRDGSGDTHLYLLTDRDIRTGIG